MPDWIRSAQPFLIILIMYWFISHQTAQELERVFSHSEASSTTSIHAACGLASARNPPLRIQVGGGPEPPKQREERHDDYYANVGDAIRTLREDVPTLFTSELTCAPTSLSTAVARYWCLMVCIAQAPQ